MNNLDSLSLKYFFEENKEFINGSIVQKIQLPTRSEIILTIRNLNNEKPQNKKLYININPKYPHICFLNEESAKKRNIEIPQKPPMFCMQLRKYLNGSKIKDFKIVKYERILELYFDYFDEIGSLTRMCLALEFMGKHSNIILYNAQNKIIVGSIHNISADKSSIREVYGGIKYMYPPLREKLDILNVSYSTFFDISKDRDIKKISENFYYFNQGILNSIFHKFDDIQDVFHFCQSLQNLEQKDFICLYWQGKENLNDAIDEYFSNIMFAEIMENKKSKLKKCLINDINKLSKLTQPDDNKAKIYKLKADYIMAYMYQIEQGQKQLIIDENIVELDENLTPQENAQKYYSQYKKAKATYEYALDRFKRAQERLFYFDSIMFNIDNSESFEEINDISDELIDLNLIQNKKTKKDELKINKVIFQDYEIYIGKNNKQNDYLISKVATADDLWFHGLNFPSSHVILKVPNNKKNPNSEVLEYCARLTKENSKAKNSGKTSIIMTKRKNLKKPPNAYLGYVTYKDEIEIII